MKIIFIILSTFLIASCFYDTQAQYRKGDIFIDYSFCPNNCFIKSIMTFSAKNYYLKISSNRNNKIYEVYEREDGREITFNSSNGLLTSEVIQRYTVLLDYLINHYFLNTYKSSEF